MKLNNLIFFLGGYDAEMCEIKTILQQHNLPFFDKKLAWGAALSAYRDELQKIENKIPVFVELNLDISYPENSIIITHHDSSAGKDRPTAIEQVIQLLNINLTDRQKLIAANDRAHIKGLIEAGATQQQIQEIRAYDRKCQGVTEEEEKKAKKICKGFESNGDLDILEIQFEHTSPITDRLYGKYQNLLIITPNDINFFGDGTIVKKLAKKFPSGWYGGNLPDEGFWGIKIKIKNDIINIKNYLRRLF